MSTFRGRSGVGCQSAKLTTGDKGIELDGVGEYSPEMVRLVRLQL